MTENRQKTECLAVLQQLQQIDFLKSSESFQNNIEHFLHRLEDNEFRIAVVGEFSSGKSTFINAILGKDVLQHASTETTATITRIINTNPSDSRCNSGRVLLRNGKVIPLADFQTLKEYTTTASNEFHVVEEIEAVELYLPVMDSDRTVVLVDTPGLNGMADGHRSQTISLIQNAHACIYLLQRRGLAESDVLFLKNELTGIQKNFIFVQNFIDELRVSEGESVPEKLAEQERILKELVIGEIPNIHYAICGISALQALAARDTSIEFLYQGNTEPLTPADREALLKRSGYEEFLVLLQNTFRTDELDAIQYGGTANAIRSWLSSLVRQISERKAMTQEAYESSRDSRQVKRLETLRERTLSNQEPQKQRLRDLIASEAKKIRRGENDKLKIALEDVCQTLQNTVRGTADLSKLENMANGGIDVMIRSSLTKPINDYYDRISQDIHNLYQTLLQRIREYSSVNQDSIKIENIRIDRAQPSMRDFALENRIAQIEQRISEEERNVRQARQDNQHTASQISQEESEVRRLEANQRQILSNRENQKKRLGTRPQAKISEETYIAREERSGLLGRIIDKIFKEKKVRRTRTVRDDSAGERWDDQKKQIDNQYHTEKQRLDREISLARQRADRLRRTRDEANAEVRRAEERVASLRRQLEDKKKTQEEIRVRARKEYIIQLKKDLCKHLEVFLLNGDDSIYSQVCSASEESVAEMRKHITEQAMTSYEAAIRDKLAWIDQAVKSHTPKLQKELDQLVEAESILQDACRDLETITEQTV